MRSKKHLSLPAYIALFVAGLALIAAVIAGAAVVFPLFGKTIASKMDLGTDTRHLIAYSLLIALIAAGLFGVVRFRRMVERNR